MLGDTVLSAPCWDDDKKITKEVMIEYDKNRVGMVDYALQIAYEVERQKETKRVIGEKKKSED